jgi:rhamnose utilization protein RhaD (predicted bifunctional aldolase and dehydrogenase)
VLAPDDLWDDAITAPDARAQLLHRAHLLGGDIRVANPGGGNFSAKGELVDHLGRPTEVLWISAWGADGALLSDPELACLRVEDVRAARDDDALRTATMHGFLAGCATATGQPHPAIETLLHAYLRAPHVDHTHPEAVIALTAVDDGRALAKKVFGDEAIWVDYQQFGPDLARRLASEIEDSPDARFVLLANHGLLTWGGTSAECYRNTIEAARRAWAGLDAARSRPYGLGAGVPQLSAGEADGYLLDVLPTLRGALSEPGARMVLAVDPDPDAREFASSDRGPALSLIGPACPDSLVKMKRVPSVVEAGGRGSAAERRTGVLAAVAAYRDDYLGYWRRNAPESEPQPPTGADLPRVFVVPGVGVLSAGEDAYAARLAEAHYRQTRRVITVCDAVGGYSSLTEAECWQDEYWPLLRNKPQLRPPRGELAGHVVLVVLGAAGGSPPADAVVQRLAALLLGDDAHLVVASSGAEATDLARAVRDAGVDPSVAESRLAVCGPEDPVRAAVLAYGGVDLVVHLQATPAAAAEVATAAAAVFRDQGWRGDYVATGPDASGVLDAVRGAGVTPYGVALDPTAAWADRKAAALRSVIGLARAGLTPDCVLTPVGDFGEPREATA